MFNQKEYKKKYYATRPWTKSFQSILSRCGDKTSRYYKKGIKNYLHTWDLEFLWKRDKAHLLKKPSIDRIDSKGDYTLSNCRFIEWLENCVHSTSISCVTPKGKVKKFRSVSSAAKWLGRDRWVIWNAFKKRNGWYNGIKFTKEVPDEK